MDGANTQRALNRWELRRGGGEESEELQPGFHTCVPTRSSICSAYCPQNRSSTSWPISTFSGAKLVLVGCIRSSAISAQAGNQMVRIINVRLLTRTCPKPAHHISSLKARKNGIGKVNSYCFSPSESFRAQNNAGYATPRPSV